MSWLNLNQSLSSLKGQITNFATEVLSEGSVQDPEAESSKTESTVKDIEEKCHNQELEFRDCALQNQPHCEETCSEGKHYEEQIAALKKLNDELQITLQSERVSRQNGLKEEESNWYWDPPAQVSRSDHEIEKQYKLQIQALQSELSTLKDREMIEHAVDNEEEINRLRQENRNLTCSLEDLDNQHQVAMERLLALKKELQRNFEVLKQEHQDLKNNNDEYSGQIKALLQKIGERDQEIESLKSAHPDYDTLQHKYQNLERIHSLLRENAEKFQEENQELHEEVFKLQEQVTKLEHDIEVAKQNEVTHMVPVDKYEQLVKELNDLKHRRDSSQVHLDEINIDDNAKSVIETLKRDINELKRKLAQQDREHQKATQNKVIKPDRIMQLYNRYVNFDLPVDYVGEMPSGTENVVMQKLEGVFKTLNSFKKDVDDLKHKLSEKKQNIDHLQAQVDDVTTENEYLTSDIQHLESELEEMKKNNDFLISEIAALKNTSKLEPIIETHEDNLAKLETELADSNRMNKTFESEIKRIENQLKDVQNEKKILQESLNEMKRNYTSMLNELQMCKVQTQAVHELENNASVKHNVKLQEAVDKIDNLQKLLHSANSKNEQLLIDIHIIENDKVLLTKQIEDLKQDKQSMCEVHKELESTNKTLNSKIHDLENKLDDSIKDKQDLDIKLKDLENELVEAYDITRRIEAENITLKDTKESVISSVTDIDKISSEKKQMAIKLDEVLQENSTLKEKNESLANEILILQNGHQELIKERDLLKQKSLIDTHNGTEFQETMNQLKLKADQYDVINNELLGLREENKKLLEKKLQLEVELSSTDGKILKLEEEFEKLIADLNEKDSIIDKLNVTINKNKIELENLHQNVTDLENSVQIKSQEIDSLVKTVDELTLKLNSTSLSLNQNHEELRKIHIEKEEINKQIYGLNDEINIKNMEISRITYLLQELEKSNAVCKSQVDSKDKEIKELKQSMVEIRDKIKASENTTQPNDEYAKLFEEKQAIEKVRTELQNVLNIKENELSEQQHKVFLLENTCKELKTVIENATLEKNELINLVNLKHNESIQYHNEIQRLNQVLLEQNNEFKRIVDEKDLLIKKNSESCANCETIRLSLKEKDEIIMALNQNISDHERLKAELVNANESVKNLSKRCEDLDKSLTIQLETVKNLTAENVQLSEQEQNSSRELERLRHHLVELEESYTQDLMASEQRLGECQARLHQVEERAKQTSTVYTSNSIRANQEVETLRNQIRLLEKQREEVQAKLSEAEDARNRSEAALTNLQVVLEQFQLDKERDICNATEKIRNKMDEVKRQNEILQNEIVRLNGKLEESIAGLQAATRLGDQVETKTAQINDLKEQVRSLQATIAAAEERYYSAISNQQDKVDKNLVKNLVVNYVLTAGRSDLNRTQILRILSTVLDFNQTECEKLGLVKSGPSGDSLAAEFVKFLQNESRPRAALPDMMGLQGGRSTPASSRKSSTIGPHPVFEVGHRRNPSTSSSNLLFQNLDSMETSSQISMESDTRVIPSNTLDTGINQTRNNEGAILKHVLKDM